MNNPDKLALHIVCPVLPVYLDGPFLIAHSVVSNASYCVPCVASLSGLSIFDFPFGRHNMKR
jgi:hypothetical protein